MSILVTNNVFSQSSQFEEQRFIASEARKHFQSALVAFELNDIQNFCIETEFGLIMFYKIDPRQIPEVSMQKYNDLKSSAKDLLSLKKQICKR